MRNPTVSSSGWGEMAVVRGDRMDDLEDGEISGSDSDSQMGVAGDERAQKPATATAFASHAFRSRGPPPRQQTVAAGYRSTAVGVASSDSDSEEEASLWRRKRQRCSNVPQAPPPSSARHGAPPTRKVNNIWGCVVQEQTQEAVAAELGIMGMEGAVSMSSRQCETYNYVLARKLMEKEREQEEQGEAAMLDTQLDDYMQGRGGEGEGEGGGRGGAGEQPKRKRPARDRLGPRAEMDFEGRYQITEEDPDDKVTDEIVHRLREPKKDLIERVVSIIGKKKAIELLAETATVEQNGGIFTMDGSRRRTPGGVYLNLLKNTPSISGKQVKKIFYDETQRETSSRKAAKKRRRHEICRKMKQAINALDLQEHDDVSRETFASDTNEALESLEDPAEPGPPEPEPEPEPQFSLGGEDAAVVYSSTDLEVF